MSGRNAGARERSVFLDQTKSARRHYVHLLVVALHRLSARPSSPVRLGSHGWDSMIDTNVHLTAHPQWQSNPSNRLPVALGVMVLNSGGLPLRNSIIVQSSPS